MNQRGSGAAAALACIAAAFAVGSTGCGHKVNASSGQEPASVSVGVTKIERKTLDRGITVSSELVPFQEADVYAKEAGYVKDLLVDYGSRVTKGQVMAVLEIPELQIQVAQDDAAIQSATDQVTAIQHELGRVEAQHHVAQLQFERLDSVSKSKPGLVAQQEVDDLEGKALATEAQVEATKANLQTQQGALLAAQAKKQHDQVLFDYAKITAPFTGVVTQRYANEGSLMQSGTNSSTQAMPLVRVSQDDLFRLVIPVPESYVRYIHIGESVDVNVPSLNRTFPGKVARTSLDVKEDTRTMHTEVDVANPGRVLVPGMYAEAAITLEHRPDALAVPLQAVNHEGERTTVFVVDAANKIDDRQVTLGVQTASDAEVLEGLREGDRVVVSDRSSLKPGQQVRPQTVELIRYQGQKEE